MATPMAGTERLEAAKLRVAMPDALIKVKEFRGDTFLCVKRERIVEVVRFLKEDPDLQYDYFSECLGADYSKWDHERDLPGRFEVIYNLMSLRHASRIFVKIGVDDGEKVPTLRGVFIGAEYPEKEIADMFGLVFEGNELVGERFLMPDDWVGFPLRKEFPLGGEDVLFADSVRGPAVEDLSAPHAGESFEGKTGSEDVGGR
ncbi:MAG: NADH-quinone oxidoreductase subunit C [Fimbriimonas ginsengisoli]|uniref:NADH-quinone oxidoreductase subunit C n=1 Tax=Fimbriimonas ginsengisoli TaxID=1005039 RepID=A0A931PUH0_FIMGI|nr:NADH-quinone oxidoreductase subunit C [Fimbriimonas ginsengisoli]